MHKIVKLLSTFACNQKIMFAGLHKETHSYLKWVFKCSLIPSIIDAQANKKLLHVEGFGSFNIEWHMSEDLKKLKCTCLEFKQVQMQPTHVHLLHANTPSMDKKKSRKCANNLSVDGMYQWCNGIMTCDQDVAPKQDKIDKE